MRALHRIVSLLMLIGGACGAVACLWALLDPSILSAAGSDSVLAPPSPRWRAALGLVISIALLLAGSGRLRHRELP